MNRAIKLRIQRLETVAPAPPKRFDELTSDELMVQLLEGYSRFLDRDDLPIAELQDVQNWCQAIVDDITLTLQLRAGIRHYPVPRCSYAGSIAHAATQWASAGGKSAYVPALNHGDTGAGEYDGFNFPDLMARRVALWKHPTVCGFVEGVQIAAQGTPEQKDEP